MPETTATVAWERKGAKFTDNRYSRLHQWRFDGGVEVPASSSPHVVRPPLSEPRAVDPEEAFVAALSSCHMLWFLSLAAKAGFVVDSYTDEAAGEMGKNAGGKMVVKSVTLRPKVVFEGAAPTRDQLNDLHHQAHAECFIANSVTSDVKVEPITVGG